MNDPLYLMQGLKYQKTHEMPASWSISQQTSAFLAGSEMMGELCGTGHVSLVQGDWDRF